MHLFAAYALAQLPQFVLMSYIFYLLHRSTLDPKLSIVKNRLILKELPNLLYSQIYMHVFYFFHYIKRSKNPVALKLFIARQYNIFLIIAWLMHVFLHSCYIFRGDHTAVKREMCRKYRFQRH